MSLEWKTVELKSIANVTMGQSPKSEFYNDNFEGMPFLQGNKTFGDKYPSFELYTTSIKKVAEKNSVLMSVRAPVGDLNIAQEDICIGRGVCGLQMKKGDNEFLYYLLKANISHLINKESGTVFGSINKNDIETFEVTLPEDSEDQQKILTILKNIDKKIEVCKDLNINLLSIADAIFKKEFRNFDEYLEGDLISSDFGLIPKNWYYKTLDEISDVAIGKTPPRKETWWFSEKAGVKWVSIKDLGNSGTYIFETSEYLTEEAIDKFNVKLIPEDTVILSFKLTVGRLGITTDEMTTNEAIAHFKLDSESPISKEYLYLYLKNFNYDELGSTSSIAKAINSKIVKKIPILVPESNKLNEFKELFENIFNEIKSNQIEINNLTKLRDTLLPKLMSGEIDVSKINCDLE
ncbi:restriction endonuclease subunit S [Methanobrevibacter thaueri]|uniref:restriction endonuclease subunit S n=1 Tax=Methanobrevibacter thaueri TaxID=190975 RepID=UPI003866BE65